MKFNKNHKKTTIDNDVKLMSEKLMNFLKNKGIILDFLSCKDAVSFIHGFKDYEDLISSMDGILKQNDIKYTDF